jgi:hypothetical protein
MDSGQLQLTSEDRFVPGLIKSALERGLQVELADHVGYEKGDPGDRSNYKILGPGPPNHAIGRSRGGLTSKIRRVEDGRGRPLSKLLISGYVNDTTMLADTIDLTRVPKGGRSRPRSRRGRVLADKGYPSRANCSYFASGGIKATISDRADQRQNRANKGSSGGRLSSMRRSKKAAASSNAVSTDPRTDEELL